MSKDLSRVKLIKQWVDEKKDILSEEASELLLESTKSGESDSNIADGLLEQVTLLEELWNYIEELERS